MSVRDSISWKVLAAGAAVSVMAACASVTAGSPLALHEHGHVAALAAASTGQVRTYYIAADEVLWDYAPHGMTTSREAVRRRGEGLRRERADRHRARYCKSLYRGYTDASFTTRIVAPTSCPAGVMPCDDTLGMIGPVIRAVVGDTIKVVFKNNTQYPASVHPHGVFYAKNAEGAPYADGTGGRGQG